MKRPRVLLLITDGGSPPAREAKVTSALSGREAPAWLRDYKELDIVAEIESRYVYVNNDANLSPGLWSIIAKSVAKEYSHFDGFVLTHDVSALHYTAPALGCALAGIGKPMVITTSPSDPRRGDHPRVRKVFRAYQGFGSKDNLLNALYLSIADISGTFVVFGNQIHNAIGLTISREPDVNVFSSLSGKLVGKVDFGLNLFPPVPRRHRRPVSFQTGFGDSLVVYEIHPGAPVTRLLDGAVKAKNPILVKIVELPGLPAEGRQVLAAAHKRGAPVFVYSELGGERSPFIAIQGVPYHTAFVLTTWALGQTNNTALLRRLINSRLREITGKGER